MYIAWCHEVSFLCVVVRSHNLKIQWRFKIIIETHFVIINFNMAEFHILYGTQTDTARNASEEIAREAVRRADSPRVMEFD